MFEFLQQHQSLCDVMMDHKLAKLGDAYVNFLYSLAISTKFGEPTGIKVKGRLLADAFRKADLRKLLPSRVDRHKQADAAEALIVYAWILDLVTMKEGLKILENQEDSIEAFSNLLLTAKVKIEAMKNKKI